MKISESGTTMAVTHSGKAVKVTSLTLHGQSNNVYPMTAQNVQTFLDFLHSTNRAQIVMNGNAKGKIDCFSTDPEQPGQVENVISIWHNGKQVWKEKTMVQS